MSDPNREAPVPREATQRSVSIADILPSESNPRQLFDEEPLRALKESICQHRVLVPILIYKQKGSDKYRILDGERRYRCCQELAQEGKAWAEAIPSNIVDAPSKLAGLLYMFSVHNVREGWDLMPTALALKEVIKQLSEEDADTKRLRQLTGLSEPQIERCRTILTFTDEFQLLSLDPDPHTRIPSNFWTEAKPVLDFISKNISELPPVFGGIDGLTRRLVEKYRAGAIRSVIHFRRIMDALTFSWNDSGAKDTQDRTRNRLTEWLNRVDYETRAAFDEFIVDERRVRRAVESCSEFKRSMDRLRLNYEIDRQELRAALEDVHAYVSELLETLRGEDPPQLDLDEGPET